MRDPSEVSLDGRVFRPSETGEESEATQATVFEYHEDGDIVWARYRGGVVRLVFLVGTRDNERLDFRYSQLNDRGETSNGHCSSQILMLPDGRLRMTEVWAWESKPGEGTGAVEEVRE